MHDLSDFFRRVSDQLFGHILPFWCGPALDPERGGWMSWLSNDLEPDRSQPKGLIVHSRILWTFSAVHRTRPAQVYRQMAERAFDFLLTRFWDAERGGVFWRLDDRGRVIEDEKKIYGQAFCIYALAEYHRAFGVAAALAQAKELFGLLERHAHDPHNGGYCEVCKRDWSEAGPEARLSEKDLSEKKSMNNHLHVLEACTNLFRVWQDERVGQRLRELIGLFEQRILDPCSGHFHHFFDEHWRVRSDTYTFGHDIEGSWLLCEAAEVLEDAKLQEHVRHVALRIAKTVLAEGVDETGGLVYEGRSGCIIDRRKESWPQAEAVIGFLNAYQLCGEREFLSAARRVWEFIERHLVDRVHGEWFWRINEDGQPDPTLPKTSEWKGPYHGTRMCLEALQRSATICG